MDYDLKMFGLFDENGDFPASHVGFVGCSCCSSIAVRDLFEYIPSPYEIYKVFFQKVHYKTYCPF